MMKKSMRKYTHKGKFEKNMNEESNNSSEWDSEDLDEMDYEKYKDYDGFDERF